LKKGKPHYVYASNGRFTTIGSHIGGDLWIFWNKFNDTFDVNFEEPKSQNILRRIKLLRRDPTKVTKNEFDLIRKGTFRVIVGEKEKNFNKDNRQ